MEDTLELPEAARERGANVPSVETVRTDPLDVGDPHT